MENNKNEVVGMLGASMAGLFPVLDFLGPILQIRGAIGGIVLLVYSIKYKRMQIKELKKK